MTCVICKHSQTETGIVTVTLERGGVTIVFKDVPAQVCENCGEQYVGEVISAQLLSEGEKAAAAGVQVEVKSFVAV